MLQPISSLFWFFAGDGYYKIVARHSGRIVEVAGASTASGAIIQQWDNNNQTCGQWKLVPAKKFSEFRFNSGRRLFGNERYSN